jgi:hypothetical protein
LLKGRYHPKAFLSMTRNIRPGLVARTQIVQFLEKEGRSRTTIVVEKTSLTYASVLHHLHLLEEENIVGRTGKREYLWALTGVGQRELFGLKEGLGGHSMGAH